MKVSERNKLISECMGKYKKVYDDYFPRGKPLEDKEWEECIQKMDEVASEYKKDIPDISGKLCMVFLNDIQYLKDKK